MAARQVKDQLSDGAEPTRGGFPRLSASQTQGTDPQFGSLPRDRVLPHDVRGTCGRPGCLAAYEVVRAAWLAHGTSADAQRREKRTAATIPNTTMIAAAQMRESAT